MTDHDRREFFAAAMAAAGFAATTSWTTRWFRPQDPQQPDGTARERQLREAAAKAKQQGKPLLVFVVPGASEKEQTEVYVRSRWLGAFLTHGGPTALLEVALCVPACATLAEVQKVTGAAAIEGAPLMLVIDVDRPGAADAPLPKVTRLDLDLDSPILAGKGRSYEPEDIAANKCHIEAGLEKLTTELHKTVHQHGLSLAALADAVTSRLDDDQRRALTTWLATGSGATDELLVRATAEVRRRLGESKDDVHVAGQQRLVEAIERELVHKPLPGGRWHKDSGCGSSPEDPTPEEQKNGQMIACGMGMVPACCERFLSFYTGQ